MQGCFEVTQNKDCKFDIVYAKINDFCKNGIDDEQLNLYSECELTCSTIKSLVNTDESLKEEYFNKLLSLSQAGLTGPTANPTFGLKALSSLKEEIVIKESGRIKNSYMITLGLYALALIVLCILIIIALKYFDLKSLYKYPFTYIGAMIGTWVSFGARKVELQFNELSIIEKDRLNPLIRLIYVGVCSLILLLFLSSGIIDISIGNISIDKILATYELQVLLGIISGLIEYKLSVGLFNKANEIFKF